MLNIKFISIFAAGGFIFSFFIGLFSKSKIYVILLRALIFAIIFGVVALLISYLYNKFLNEDSASDLTPETGSPSTTSPETKGQKVDFVVQDEEFTKSDSENHFVVGENHQMLNNTDISSNQKNEMETVASGGNVNSVENSTSNNSEKFVPLKNFETVTNFSGREAVPAASVSPENQDVKPSSNFASDSQNDRDLGDNIDTLPDMNSFSFSDGSEEDGDSGEVLEDTDDSFGASVSTGTNRKTEHSGEVQDASLIARAISSVLSGENS